MESQECLFDMDDAGSINFLEDKAQKTHRDEYDHPLWPENESLNSNFGDDIGNIPPVDEDLLLNQKLIDCEDAHSGIFEPSGHWENQIQPIYFENESHRNRWFDGGGARECESIRSQAQSYLQSLVYEESKWHSNISRQLILSISSYPILR